MRIFILMSLLRLENVCKYLTIDDSYIFLKNRVTTKSIAEYIRVCLYNLLP